jgi:hypothetical protein
MLHRNLGFVKSEVVTGAKPELPILSSGAAKPGSFGFWHISVDDAAYLSKQFAACQPSMF